LRWNWASVYWLVWICVGFLPLELWALWTRQPQYTLSDQVWHLEGSGSTFARFFIGAFCVWLTLHMVFRLFR